MPYVSDLWRVEGRNTINYQMEEVWRQHGLAWGREEIQLTESGGGGRREEGNLVMEGGMLAIM